MSNIYDYSVFNTKDQEVSLANFKGKVLVIIDTATSCGFTPQYEQFKKSDVNGSNELKFFAYLKNQKGFEGFDKEHPLHDKIVEKRFEPTSDMTKVAFSTFWLQRC